MIERLAADSRACAPGVAFVAYPGETSDGRAHIADALRRGCAAVLWEAENFAWHADWRIPNAQVRGLRRQAGALANAFYGRPSEAMWMCGVTGTNGKTSCSQWLAALLGAEGEPTAVIGTLGAGFPGSDAGFAPLVNTTPGAIELHALLDELRRKGARAVAMEVSSHALVQERVNGVAFDCALFTNLTHDHLDYHGSMDAYADAKARLFDTPGLAAAVLNLDDVRGVQFAQRLAGRGLRTIGYALSPSAVVQGSVTEFIAARDIRIAGDAMDVTLESSWGGARTLIRQLGRYNVSNALGVLGCLVAHGARFADAAARLADLPAVPGRMQQLGGGACPLVVVDYAHTPDALEKVLNALRPATAARGGTLVAVFGAGGDRDPSKRPLMGRVAAQFADFVVLTSDNPRSEDPLAILAAIESGVGEAIGGAMRRCALEPDRARAIEAAVGGAAAGDVVLIAGKGHETYQEVAGRRLAFSDVDAAGAALTRWQERAHAGGAA
jgi:UDP-N-acetylmuramoyl-L-alanyl-D-glutamate--2,6-diaminopimelate ligase